MLKNAEVVQDATLGYIFPCETFFFLAQHLLKQAMFL